MTQDDFDISTQLLDYPIFHHQFYAPHVFYIWRGIAFNSDDSSKRIFFYSANFVSPGLLQKTPGGLNFLFLLAHIFSKDRMDLIFQLNFFNFLILALREGIFSFSIIETIFLNLSA